jgi:hypothetical protein
MGRQTKSRHRTGDKEKHENVGKPTRKDGIKINKFRLISERLVAIGT